MQLMNLSCQIIDKKERPRLENLLLAEYTRKAVELAAVANQNSQAMCSAPRIMDVLREKCN